MLSFLVDSSALPVVEDNPAPLFSIGNLDFFIFAPEGMPYWAILSLILTAAGIVYSITTIIRAVSRKKHENRIINDYYGSLYYDEPTCNADVAAAIEEREKTSGNYRFAALSVMYFLNIVCVLLLFLVQKFKGVIVLFDWWVLIHAVIFAFIILCGELAVKKQKI